MVLSNVPSVCVKGVGGYFGHRDRSAENVPHGNTTWNAGVREDQMLVAV